MQDSDAARHRSIRLSGKPQPEHQYIPKLRRPVAVTGLVLLPDLSDEGTGKIGIMPLQNVRSGKIVHAAPEPFRQWNSKSHLVAINDVAWQIHLHGFLKNVFTCSSS